jgi:hypothetical protein
VGDIRIVTGVFDDRAADRVSSDGITLFYDNFNPPAGQQSDRDPVGLPFGHQAVHGRFGSGSSRCTRGETAAQLFFLTGFFRSHRYRECPEI